MYGAPGLLIINPYSSCFFSRANHWCKEYRLTGVCIEGGHVSNVSVGDPRASDPGDGFASRVALFPSNKTTEDWPKKLAVLLT